MSKLIFKNLIIFILFGTIFSFGVDFQLRYKTNLRGNMKVIGNTVLARKVNGKYADGTTATNSGDDLRYVDIDNDTATFNSSSATLQDSAIIPTVSNPTPAKVKWAGLYWSGYLHTYDSNDGTQTQYKNLSDDNSIKNVIANHTVKFKIGNTTHDITTHTVLGKIQQYANTNYKSWSYGCFADVTDLMKGSDPRNTYTVANIPSMEGATNKGSYNDGLGNSGAWTLVVIYENTSVGEKTRNATVFDGFAKISNGNPQTINVSGFRTPKSGNVDSTLSVFANEGDKYIKGDDFIFKNLDGDKQGLSVTLKNSEGFTGNFFDSSISGVDSRTPKLTNNNGIDIHTEQMGTSGYNVVSTNQTKASITMTSSQDVYHPVMVAFATELYMPKLCYDYTATLDNEMMQMSGDREFLPHKDSGTLRGKVFIRSLEGDFPYLNSTLKIEWSDITTPSLATPPFIAFNKARVQNPHEYAYIDPEYTDDVNGRYYIGIESGGYKGVIKPYESLYAISEFDATKLYGSKIQLNAEVNASLVLDENDPNSLTTYTFSTSDGTLPRCEGTVAYNPKWYQFNVEKLNSTYGDYALNTQVTGTNYNLQVASYTKDISGKYTIRSPYVGAMEVELFEMPAFQSLGSYEKYDFDRICEDSNSSKPWGDHHRRFALFYGPDTVPFPIEAKDNKYAMRNAAVRLWVLMADYDGDGKLNITVPNICTNTDSDCFRKLWANDPYYKTQDKCDTQCASGSTDENCYKCLRTYYSQPICSRDNFSVRPYGVQLEANTMGNIMRKNDNESKNSINLISGKTGDYVITMTAKSANNTNALGYYFRRISTESRDIANNLFDTLKEFFGLKFDNSKVNASVASCADSSHKRFDVGSLGWKLENDNVGNYDIILVDKDWTLVDQARYPYKAPASKGKDDCIPNSAVLENGGKAGCNVQSFEVDNKFYKIPVKFVPNKISISGVSYGSVHTDKNPSLWAYMNNLSESLDMAALFQGDIVAQNAKGAKTTNFTAGCFAQDVNISTSYYSQDLDNNGKLASNTAIGLQYAQNYNGAKWNIETNPTIRESNTSTYNDIKDKEIKIHISKDAFLDENQGSLLYDLRYAINKLYDKAIDPIRVLFTKLESLLLDIDDHSKTTPTVVWKDGNSSTTDPKFTIRDTQNLYTKNESLNKDELDKDIEAKSFKFLYGRVYTNLEAYGESGKNVTSKETKTNFDVLVYSSKAPSGSLVYDDVDKTGILDTTAVDSAWYRVKAHSIDKKDGQIDKIAIKSAEKSNPTITPQTDVKFDSDSQNTTGRTPAVTFSYKGERPNKVVFRVIPSVWLKYNKNASYNGEPEFVINFTNDGYNWVGKGKTGNVVTQPLNSSATNRLNW